MNTNEGLRIMLTEFSIVMFVLLSLIAHGAETAKHSSGVSAKDLGKIYSGDVWKYLSNLEQTTSKRLEQMESRLTRTFDEKIRLVNHSASIEYLEKMLHHTSEDLSNSEEKMKNNEDRIEDLHRYNQQQQIEIRELKKSVAQLQETVANLVKIVQENEYKDDGTDDSKTTASILTTTAITLPIDCQDSFDNEDIDSHGFYYREIKPRLSASQFKTCCYTNQSGEAWTVIQRRLDGSVEFYRSWDEYKEGFGNVVGGEFWLGNDHIYQLTNQGDYRLRIEMKTWDDESHWAEYRHFRISDEADKYRLHVTGYRGDAGNSLSSQWDNDHNGQQFSTYDSDNDERFYDNCAEHFRGAWWFRSCFQSHLNGVYYPKDSHSNFFIRNGIQWNSIHPHSSLKEVTMMIRANPEENYGLSNGIEQEN